MYNMCIYVEKIDPGRFPPQEKGPHSYRTPISSSEIFCGLEGLFSWVAPTVNDIYIHIYIYIYIKLYIYIYIPSDRSHMILVHWKENLLNSISEGQGNGPQIPANGDADWRYSLPAAPQPKSTHGWHISKASVSPGLPGGFPPERTYGTHLQEGIGFHGQK